jgi:hypothetical protein
MSVENTAGFNVGDEVLIIQTQGSEAGAYEFRTIQSISNGVLSLNGPLTHSYQTNPVADSPCPNGYYGELFNGTLLSGSPRATRCDRNINFDWGGSIPHDGGDHDFFSMRWTGRFYFPAGTYQFNLHTDDTGNLYLDDQLASQATCCNPQTVFRNIAEGEHEIRLDYVEFTGEAFARLSINGGSLPSDTSAQVIRVPHFRNVTVHDGGVLTAHPWDGKTGGVVAFRASGVVSVLAGGSIDASGKGFRGGQGGQQTPNFPGGGFGESYRKAHEPARDYQNLSSLPNNGGGVGGLGRYGGGTASGGGGGSYGTTGSLGNPYNVAAGTAYGQPDLSSIFLGSGGGGGGKAPGNTGNSPGGNGGTGGGIILMFVQNLDVSAGFVSAEGNGGGNATRSVDESGGGGGGSGGSILIHAGVASLGTDTVLAEGGIGGRGSKPTSDNNTDQSGGNGGAGRIRVEFCETLSGSTNPPASVQQLDCNHPPTASPDSYSISEDTPLTVGAPGVLGNDTDDDTDALTAVLANEPSNGTLTLLGDGSFNYLPNPNFNGTDSFTYQASDGLAVSDETTVSLTVTSVNDPPSFTPGSDVMVDEDSDAYSALWARDINAGATDESGQVLTFLVTGNSKPSLFSDGPAVTPDGTLTFSPAANANGSATITVVLQDDGGTANDGRDTSAPKSFTIAIGPINDAPEANAGPDKSVAEGSSTRLEGSGMDVDDESLTFAWAPPTHLDDPSRPDPIYTGVDDMVENHELTVSDPGELSDSDTMMVTVYNVDPTVGPISAPIEPVAVGFQVTATAPLTDPGVLDTHTALWDWGDGTTSSGTVAPGMASGTHTYTTPGVYTLKLTVTDDDDGMGVAPLYEYVVAYDPIGGFVTGNGRIESPMGAYAADPTLSGIAQFAFVSKYTRGANIPTGNTRFVFRVADLEFDSSSYQWLVVASARAQFKGSGTIKGRTGSYGFLLTAVDGDLSGGGESDKLRIKIWDNATGVIVYDNQMGSTDASAPTTAIASGKIMIHR